MYNHLQIFDTSSITESLIHILVHNFYQEVRSDGVIGHIFEQIIQDDWDEHLLRMEETTLFFMQKALE
ncbi:MAG: hypothetical protein AB8U25_03625 [Rickettsiales endosymbiont of Dermacentor nuttalli]